MTFQSLPAAKQRLDKALTALFDPIIATINRQVVESPSLWHQLEDSLGGISGERSGGAAGMPLWPDAVDLKHMIETQLALWNQGRGFDAMDRVHLIDLRAWKVEDTPLVETIATTMENWAITIQALLNPTPRLSLPNPCPACSTRTVYKQSAGERVRQPALQITATGCHCLACKTQWGVDRYMWLAKVLGYEPPEGVNDESA